jgi:hypothetical protein
MSVIDALTQRNEAFASSRFSADLCWSIVGDSSGKGRLGDG